jgi:uncharacterized protein YndB with AHSA1/START domain/GNAT superfamily N-acetyltransferase
MTKRSHVRRLTAADLAAYRALHRFGIGESPTGFIDVVETDAARPDAEVVAMLMRGEGWGVFEGERLIGKLVADALPYPSLAPTFWLRAVYVHPDARGTGASGRLIRAAIEDARAKGASRMALWVHDANPHARALYERIGFRESGRIPRGISINGELVDDVLMSMALDNFANEFCEATMTKRSTTHATFVIERDYKAAPAKVFDAFANPVSKAKWFVGPEHWEKSNHKLDFRVGGKESVSGGPPGGAVHYYDAEYWDIVANERIVSSYEMRLDAQRISVSLASMDFRPNGAGTKLVLTEQGIFLDGYDDAGERERGTRELLDQLETYLSK